MDRKARLLFEIWNLADGRTAQVHWQMLTELPYPVAYWIPMTEGLTLTATQLFPAADNKQWYQDTVPSSCTIRAHFHVKYLYAFSMHRALQQQMWLKAAAESDVHIRRSIL